MFFSIFSRPRLPLLHKVTEEGFVQGLLRVALKTDTGNVRTNNEDAAVFVYPDAARVLEGRGVVLALADGMGGHNSGEVASNIALEQATDGYYKAGNREVTVAITQAIEGANRAIYAESKNNTKHTGMGTTCTLLALVDRKIYMGHIGDSRAYLLQNGDLHQLTTDHTLVGSLVAEGKIEAEEAENHPQRNVLLKALGIEKKVSPEVKDTGFRLAGGDKLLLCSDGLYEYFTHEELRRFCLAHISPAALAEQLVETAKERGGHDNITVIVAEALSDVPETKENDVS